MTGFANAVKEKPYLPLIPVWLTSLPPVRRPYQKLPNFQICSAILFQDLGPVVFQKSFLSYTLMLGVSCQNWISCTQYVWHTRSYDIIMVVQTWLSADILDYELNIPGYCLQRRYRNRNGSEVLMCHQISLFRLYSIKRIYRAASDRVCV